MFFFSFYTVWGALFVIVAAFILDLLLGDPKWLPHPVRLIGALTAALEEKLNDPSGTPAERRKGGIIATLLVVSATHFTTLLILFIAQSFSVTLLYIISIFMAWTTISARCLDREATHITTLLRRSDIGAARSALSFIVGRDTANLDEKGVTCAVVETVSENTSDGVIAPLFYLALGGPALSLTYKAINTLDSMIGYKNRRYMDFGRFAALLDDAANFVPARITAYLMVVSSFILGLDWRTSLKIINRDAGLHDSPNAGLPEAAVAGAVGIRLGGPSSYGNVVKEKPYIGDPIRPVTLRSVSGAIRLMYVSAILIITVTALVAVAAEIFLI